jgi:hypothetical protein
MARRMSGEVAGIGLRLVDEAYMSWRTAEIQCQTALRAWLDARPRDRGEPTASTARPWIASRRPPATSNGCRTWRTPP